MDSVGSESSDSDEDSAGPEPIASRSAVGAGLTHAKAVVVVAVLDSPVSNWRRLAAGVVRGFTILNRLLFLRHGQSLNHVKEVQTYAWVTGFIGAVLAPRIDLLRKLNLLTAMIGVRRPPCWNRPTIRPEIKLPVPYDCSSINYSTAEPNKRHNSRNFHRRQEFVNVITADSERPRTRTLAKSLGDSSRQIPVFTQGRPHEGQICGAQVQRRGPARGLDGGAR
ncbi:hypothetical protein VTN31DRAFT_1858 [Thermomyces dupontii]|uniref:uncharacterized protein n=1 Tax=Talaromyces thermophilus TaxID=28565 RepID=UPI0037440E8F